MMSYLGGQSTAGLSPGHPAARAPQNLRIWGQEGPQEGAQSFRAADLALAGSSQAEPGPPLPRGVGAAPASKAGVQLPRLEAAQLGQAPGYPEVKAGGQGGGGVPHPRQAKGHPAVSPDPGLGQDGASRCVPSDSVAARTPLCRCSRTSALPPTSSSGSIKIMSKG